MLTLKATESNTSILKSVQNGLRLLRLFSKEKPVWGITDMATTLQLNKSTVSRLVADLVAEGYVQKTKNKYKLGLSLLCLSGVITSNLEMHREAKDPLQELVNKVAETAHLSILEGSAITYLHKVECKHPVRLLSHIGKQNPAFCTSSGKVLLAYHSKETIQSVIKSGLPKMGPNSQTDPQALLKELHTIRETGYSICIEELHEDVVSIAAPIRDYTGEVISAVSVVGPLQRITREKIPFFVQEIVHTAAIISTKLGYSSTLMPMKGGDYE